MSNPNKYNSVKTLIDEKKTLATYADELYGNETTPSTVIDPLKVTAPDTSFFADYKTIINGPEATGLQTEIADKQTEIDKIKLRMLTTRKDMEKQYE